MNNSSVGYHVDILYHLLPQPALFDQEHTISNVTEMKTSCNISNGTSRIIENTDSDRTLSKLITLCLCWLAIVIGNSLVIAVHRIYRRKHFPDFLIVVLSALDIVNALGPVLISIVIYGIRPDGFKGISNNYLCYFYNSAATMLRLSACFVMTMMALDRAISVQFPVYYRTKLRFGTMKRWVTALLIGALIIACLPLAGVTKVYKYDSVCSFDFGSAYAIGIAALGYLQLLIVLVCYITVVKGLFGYIGK